MKIRFMLTLICLFMFASTVFSQRHKAEKVDEFPWLPCSALLARADAILVLLQAEPDSKAYFIYYEGGTYPTFKKTAEGYERFKVDPARGDALNRTKALSLYLTKYRKVPAGRIVLVDGGYRGQYEVETWIVPKTAEPPVPTPTLTQKDVKFRKGKPFPVADCERIYDDS